MSGQLFSIYHQLGSLIEQAREEGVEFQGLTAFRVATNMTLSDTRASSKRKGTLRVWKEKLKARKSSKEKKRPNCLRKPRRSPTIKKRGIQRQSRRIIANTKTHFKRRNSRFTSVSESVKMRKRQKTSYAEFFDSDSSYEDDRDSSSSSSSEDEPKPVRRRTRTRRNIMTRENSKPQQDQVTSAPAAIFPCDMCDFNSTCRSALTDHRFQDHANELGETTAACSSPSSTGGSAADQDHNFGSTVESVEIEPLTNSSDPPYTSDVLRGKRPFFKICRQCSEEFHSLYDYRLHTECHDKRVFKCNQCRYVSRFQVGLNMHMKRHRKSVWKVPSLVVEALTVSAPVSPASDSQHSTTKKGFEAEPFMDQNVVTIFPDSAQESPPSRTLAKQQLNNLLPTESSSLSFTCPLCQQKFQRELLLKIHLKSHSYLEKQKELLCSTSSCQNPTADKLGLDEQIPTHKVSAAVQSTSQLQLADIFFPTNIIKVELLEDPNPPSDNVGPDLSPNNLQQLPRTKNQNTYICYLCKYVCSEDSELKTHIASHVIHSITFDCSQCNFSCSNPLDVAQHNVNCHSDLTHKPSVPSCAIQPIPKRLNPVEQSEVKGKSNERNPNFLHKNQQTVSLASSLHATVNNGNNCINVKARRGRTKAKLICRYCFKKIATKSKLLIHERTHTIKCSRCSFIATSRRNLKMHKATHTGQIFYCMDCDYTASSEQTIRNHQRNHHPETYAQDEKPSSQPVVAIAGPSKKRSNLNGKVHGVVWKDQVEGLSPSDPSPSEEEEDVAPSEDYSDSDWCQESGNASETVGEARRKLLKCEFCNRQFDFECHLRTHLRSHTGERPFSCPYCDYTTAYRHCLTSHLTNHTKDRPYKCKLCSYSSTLSYHVMAHLKKDHGKIAKAYRHSKSSLKKLVCKQRRSQ